MIILRILIIRSSGFAKTTSLFNLSCHQPDIDKIYLYAKGPYEAKNQFLITNEKKLAQSILMILNLLLNIQTIWMIFIKILKNKIQIKKKKNIDRF